MKINKAYFFPKNNIVEGGMKKMKLIDNELLAKYINSTGLNYSELARTVQISRNTIYNVLLGDTQPSLPVINCLASSLDFTLEDFVATFFPNIQFKK